MDAMRVPLVHDGEDDGSTGRFVLQGGQWPQESVGSPVTITYSYNNLLDGGLKNLAGESLEVGFIRSSIEEALGLWASVAPLHFVEVEDEGGPVPRSAASFYPPGQYGTIRFHHRRINGPDQPGGTPMAKALAFFPATNGNVAGDVVYDNGDPWEEIGTLSEPDVLGAAVHEIGHTLGIGHTTIPEANMYWIFTRTNGLGTASLHEDDIAAIRAIYGEGVGSVTTLAIIPEPGWWGLILSAAMGYLPCRRAYRERPRRAATTRKHLAPIRHG